MQGELMKEIFEPIKAARLKDVFIERFEELILSGKLAIGEKLPSERELALQLGVSRPVVHEGLIELTFKGLVSMKPRVGAVVNDYRKQGSLALLTSLLNYHRDGIEPNLLSSLLDMRKLIEVETARLAALNRSADQLRVLRDLLDREEAAGSGEIDRIAGLDFDFHHQIAMATGNMIYPLLLNSFRELYTSLSGRFFSDPKVVPEVFSFHRKLVEAIEKKNEKTAVKVMKCLLDHGEEHLQSMLKE